jgi:hypothetical protein
MSTTSGNWTSAKTESSNYPNRPTSPIRWGHPETFCHETESARMRQHPESSVVPGRRVSPNRPRKVSVERPERKISTEHPASPNLEHRPSIDKLKSTERNSGHKKVKLSPSPFIHGCVCGHGGRNRNVIFKTVVANSDDQHTIQVPMVKMRFRSLELSERDS